MKTNGDFRRFKWSLNRVLGPWIEHQVPIFKHWSKHFYIEPRHVPWNKHYDLEPRSVFSDQNCSLVLLKLAIPKVCMTYEAISIVLGKPEVLIHSFGSLWWHSIKHRQCGDSSSNIIWPSFNNSCIVMSKTWTPSGYQPEKY